MTWQIHSIMQLLLMLLAMGFGAAAFGRGFRIYTINTIVLLATFGALTSAEAGAVEVNGPTPWIGVFERLNIGVFLVWIVVLAALLWNAPGPSHEVEQERVPKGSSSATGAN